LSPLLEKVTVVIPTYRRGSQARPAVESALEQEGVDVEVLLVDDASGDRTRRELDQLSSPRVRVLHQEQNQGAPAARQRGTEEASSRLVAYLDDDDRWTPTHMRACIAAMDGTGAQWAYGGVLWVNVRLEPLNVQRIVPADQILRELLIGNALVTPSSLVADRSLVLDVGGWDPELRSMGDWDIALKLAARAAPAASTEHSVRYVRHDDSMSRTALVDARAEFRRIRRRHTPLAREHGTRIRSGAFWRWLAFNAQESGDRWAATTCFLRAALAERRTVDLGRAGRSLLRK
jgi:glycosyltransferase involved in cell wall biosynthesis